MTTPVSHPFELFEISVYTLNIFSFMLGMFFAATMWRVRAMYYVAFYFIGLSLYYGVKYYIATQGGTV